MVLAVLTSRAVMAARLAVLAALLMAVAIAPAIAQSLAPVDTMLTTVTDALTGPTGRLIGILGVAAVGVLFLVGRMNWIAVVSVIVGVAMIFGAAEIVDGFAGV